jgi:hypothetical protein
MLPASESVPVIQAEHTTRSNDEIRPSFDSMGHLDPLWPSSLAAAGWLYISAFH